MKRKVSALLVLVFVLALFAVPLSPSAAADDGPAAAAATLYELGMMYGVGTFADGSVDFALGDAANRQTAVTMLVRVLGKAAEASGGSYVTPFDDFSDWAAPYVGYAYKTGLTVGTSSTTFGGLAAITAQQYLTMMLRALGYGNDFAYDEACSFAASVGLSDGSYTTRTKSFTRGDIAVISLTALSLKVKGTNTSLFTSATGRPLSELESAAAAASAAAPDMPKAVIYTNTAPGINVSQNSAGNVKIDYSNRADGYVMVSSVVEGDPKLVVIVTAPSGTQYRFFFTDTKGNYQAFPLPEGSGSYQTAVYKNISGTSYTTLHSVSFTAAMPDEVMTFRRANIYVDFTAETKCITTADALCNDSQTELEKVSSIYYYVINNYSYDTPKAQTVVTGYRPVLDDIFAAKKGICFDYAAMMSAMLRSQGVPSKLVIGYAGSNYHAWINVYTEASGWMDAVVYFDGDSWKLMDPTFASTANNSASINQYIGNTANYKAMYVY